MSEPWLSVVGGGAVAAVITVVATMLWDRRKQAMDEDWEFRRYEANLIHFGTAGIIEAFFPTKNELLYLTSTIQLLVASFTQLEAEADQLLRRQGGAALVVGEVDRRKQELLQPFQNYNQQQIASRWYQYEQKGKENQTKAEVHLMALKRLVSPALYDDLFALFTRLSAPWPWDLPHAQEKLAVFEAATPEVLALRERLLTDLETKLGRTKTQS